MSFIEHCKEHHSLPDICCPDPGIDFSKEEALVLWKFLEHEHIPYGNLELLETVRKLSRFIDKVSQ